VTRRKFHNRKPKPAPLAASADALITQPFPADIDAAADAAIARALATKVKPCDRCGISTSNAHPAGCCRRCVYDMSENVDADDLAVALVLGLTGHRPGCGRLLRRAGILVDFSETGLEAPNGNRWAHVDQEAAATAWDAAYGNDFRPALTKGGRIHEERGKRVIEPLEVIRQGPPAPRDPRRPPTESERLRAAIESKRAQLDADRRLSAAKVVRLERKAGKANAALDRERGGAA
jgi:hypothetical protein